MSNKYSEMLNKKIEAQHREDIISSLQKNLSVSSEAIDDSIYELVKNNRSNSKLNIDTLLKYYLLNQILQEKPEEKQELLDTTNPNIKKDTENHYYRFTKGTWNIDECILEVYDDGSYLEQEKRTNFSYKIQKVCTIDDKVKSIQLINPMGQVETNKIYAVEILGLRKEYVQRHKYSGYSGNSIDIIASILNKLQPPVETGYYMDRSCNLYKWSESKKCFIRNSHIDHLSPLLADYDFEKSNIVIKKEYTGI